MSALRAGADPGSIDYAEPAGSGVADDLGVVEEGDG